MDDLRLLEDLLDCEKLTEDQTTAFTQMLDALKSRKITKLSTNQHKWAEDLHNKLDLGSESVNLVSSGAIKVTEAERASLQEFVVSLGPKRLRPPGRA